MASEVELKGVYEKIEEKCDNCREGEWIVYRFVDNLSIIWQFIIYD